MSKLLPPLRGQRDLLFNKRFLIGPEKNLILRNLEFGFRADWAPVMPPIEKAPRNFLPGAGAVSKARKRFLGEDQNGRMIAGVGWTRKMVKRFMKQKAYVMPCGAVPKNDDPWGRIIHNYSYPQKHWSSINSALTNTSVKYITFK